MSIPTIQYNKIKLSICFQLKSSSESNDKTTIKFRRLITSCYYESFDWKGQGDSVIVMYKLGSDDWESVDDMPEEQFISVG